MFEAIKEFKKGLQDVAIKAPFASIFDCKISYYIDEKDNILEIEIRDIENFGNKKYDLPTLDEVKKTIKKRNKKIAIEKIKKIEYRFVMCNDCKNLEIDAKDADIFIGFSNCDSLKITGADNVFIRFVNAHDNLEIEAKAVEFHNVNTHVNNNFNVKADLIKFWMSRIHTNNEINLNAKKLKFLQNALFAKDSLSLNADEIEAESSEFSADGNLIIDDKNCDEIKNVSASKIIYNGMDITNTEEILMPTLRQHLLKDLYKIRNNVRKNIENELRIETEKLKKNLNNAPVTKVLKK